ncbi:hypothetical protein [Xanthobacter pseudotagetidis]|uniref:hypothetical protein n=1 Tax=Xanthobacter pseudotagetidis TaxID=3119911 RepID=UPI0037278C29
MEPFIRDGTHLRTGRPFKRLGGMRSREALANWLLCVTVNAVDQRKLTFSSDPTGGDGIIHDEASGDTWLTEHVYIPPRSAADSRDLKALILDAIEQKRSKGGHAYASGKTLVVFLDAGTGMWFPNRVARELPQPLHFEAVWAVGLQGVSEGVYTYGVTLLDATEGDAPTYIVCISVDFDLWEVIIIQ